jgi:SAM-dependent methyltransferase
MSEYSRRPAAGTSPLTTRTDGPSSLADADAWFDQHLPRRVRARSLQFWTPVSVAAHAAGIFHKCGAKRILDVGCGPGKFCLVAGFLRPELEVHGVEQRPRLVRQGQRMARYLGVRNVRFSVGDVTRIEWDRYDGFYFFNPFGENMFRKADRFDDLERFSPTRFGTELLAVERLLAQARVGTVLVTYHGVGGPIPSSYTLVSDERLGSDHVRTWVKGGHEQPPWAWFETVDGVLPISRENMHKVLVALVNGEAP